jgi:hypothetical protein
MRNKFGKIIFQQYNLYTTSVAEPHNFHTAPGKNSNAAPAAPAPTLMHSKSKFLKRAKV